MRFGSWVSRWTLCALAVGAASTALVACSSNTTSANSGAPTATSVPPTSRPAATSVPTVQGPSAQLASSKCDKSTGLTVYSAQGYDSDATKAFQQQTGITTKLVDDSTGPLVAKISAEGSNPQWDVVWFDGAVTMQDLDNHGYLLKWKSSNISNYTEQGKGLIAPDYAYYPTGVTAAGAIIYNKNKAPSTLPSDWNDLLNPAYKGQIAMNDPAFSGPAYPFIAGIAQLKGGESQGKQFFTKLKANGLSIFQTNDPTLSSVKTGAKELAIVQDSAYYGAVAGGATNLGIIYPKSGVAELPSVVGIAAHAAHPACAEAFVNWLMSPAGQKVMTHHDPTDGDTYFVELVKGVTPVVSRQTSTVPFFRLDVPKWAGVENELKQWFHNNIVSGG